ncbi:OB-fold domain-containing protein [Croceicoccus sp. BE223]|uniref:Zn-ribbon domain-containing OB-fold protein n=1 Tax=Croceicoccus sp. BE223 TaxID=2817716 RepID=UPI00285F062D|nr:OB-fold domain-containing protein [Croceicoccus sp. BE223]MDR7103698.1 putative OB-fold protein [Croceicoccus sp. BE223]
MTKAATTEQPVAPYTKIDEAGDPYLVGSRCGACAQTHLGEFENCPKCGARGQMTELRLANHGTLYNYTIVHRSLPGVKVPFVSATVDLDGGGTVRGNLLDIEPDPEHVKFGMPVDVVFRSASTAVANGEGYLAHFFVPAQEAAR